MVEVIIIILPTFAPKSQPKQLRSNLLILVFIRQPFIILVLVPPGSRSINISSGDVVSHRFLDLLGRQNSSQSSHITPWIVWKRHDTDTRRRLGEIWRTTMYVFNKSIEFEGIKTKVQMHAVEIAFHSFHFLKPLNIAHCSHPGPRHRSIENLTHVWEVHSPPLRIGSTSLDSQC